MDHYREPDADTSVEQPDPTHTTPAAKCMTYVFIQGLIAMTIANTNFLIRLTMSHGTHTNSFQKS